MCAPCCEITYAYTRRKREAGECFRCSTGGKAIAAGLCLRCWYKKIAADCLKARGTKMDRTADMLQELWDEQNGKCAISGVELIPGDNASLDHIVPRSKGGTDERSNLRWADWYVNQAKSNMTHEEFVAMCKRVVAHDPYKWLGRLEPMKKWIGPWPGRPNG